MNGLQLTSLREGNNVIPVNLYSDNINSHSAYEDISNALVPTAMPGVMVPVRQVATVTP